MCTEVEQRLARFIAWCREHVGMAQNNAGSSSMSTSADDPIRHVIVLMLENRSFDQMLGCLQQLYPQLDGIAPGQPPRTNTDDKGVAYQQLPGASFVAPADPNHDYEHVLYQIANGNRGFVQDYVNCFP